MAILYDSRPINRDMTKCFQSIQSHWSQPTFYNPSVAAQTYYISPTIGIPRRWELAVNPTDPTGNLVHRCIHVKTGNTGPRTEASFPYEAATVTRFFMWEFLIPDDYVFDSTIPESIIGQWHENYQPQGGRPPPFALFLKDTVNGTTLNIGRSHDNGDGNSGSSNPSVPIVTVDTSLAFVEKNRWYRVAVKCKAEGVANDFMQVWLDGVLKVDYSGYVGYPHYNGSSVYDQQNYFKYGSYTYFAAGGLATKREFYYKGCVVGDGNETISSMNTFFDTLPAVLPRRMPRYAIAVIGGSNVLGAGTSGVLNKSLYGTPIRDPIYPATNAQASLLPALAQRMFEKGVSARVFNCAKASAGLTSYTGLCRGAHSTSTAYVAGDIVVPASPVGVTSFIPLGLKYIAETTGTSSGSAPTWPTTEFGSVIDGGVTWRAERREAYDAAGYVYKFGDVGFNPLGLASSALQAVKQTNSDKYFVVLAPQLDAAQNTRTTQAVIDSLTSYFSEAGVEVITSSQSASTTLDEASLSAMGRAIAEEI